MSTDEDADAGHVTEELVEILTDLRQDLLLTIAVARMAPRAGALAAQLVNGIQIPFRGNSYGYSVTRGRAPSVFDVCDPDGLRPGWTPSPTTIAAAPLLAALAYGSEHYSWGGRMWLPTFFSLWEEDYRHRLAAAHGCKPRDFQIPFFGDLRKLRNDVAHRGGVARADGAATCEVLRWFAAGDPIMLTHKHFKEVIENFPWRALAIRPAPVPPGKTNFNTSIDDDLSLRVRQAAAEDGLSISDVADTALEAWLNQRRGTPTA